MSDESQSSNSGASIPESPDKAASTPKAPDAVAGATAATPAPAKPAAEEPAPLQHGDIGQKLTTAGHKAEALAPDANGTEAIRVDAADLMTIGEFLKSDCQFDLLLSCSGVDWKTHRESVYHFYSLTNHNYLTLKVNAGADDHSPSLHPIWNAADWHEREAYDLLGIHYDGHPNLQRILMPTDWLGCPLRKDYKMDDPRLVWNER